MSTDLHCVTWGVLTGTGRLEVNTRAGDTHDAGSKPSPLLRFDPWSRLPPGLTVWVPVRGAAEVERTDAGEERTPRPCAGGLCQTRRSRR
jgi:hypothetical protein